MIAKLWFLIGLLLFVIGCGGSDDNVDASVGDAAGDGDAAADAPDADSTEPDAGEDETAVECGDTTCASDSECCVEDGEDPECVAEGQCEGDVIECESPDDCPNDDICCRNQGAEALCTSADQCSAFVCEVDEDCPGAQQECCEGETSSTCALSCVDE